MSLLGFQLRISTGVLINEQCSCFLSLLGLIIGFKYPLLPLVEESMVVYIIYIYDHILMYVYLKNIKLMVTSLLVCVMI